MYKVVLVSTMRYHLTLIRMAIIKKNLKIIAIFMAAVETETQSPIQDKLKEKHAKTHSNQTNKD